MKGFFRFVVSVFQFFGKILSFVRNTLLNLLLMVVVIILIFSFFPTTREFTIRNNSALVLSIIGNVVEEKQVTDPVNELLSESIGIKDLPRETLLQDILDVIHAAAKDSRIKCLVLDLDRMGNAGIDQLETIGNALKEFRKNGKKVIAAEDFFTQKKYFLASYADTVILNPMGAVDLHGFGVYRLYFKDILDKLHINVHVFRVGRYKSAIEPLIGNSMSTEAKDQNRKWLASLWSNFTSKICKNRSLASQAVDNYINNVAQNLSDAGGDAALLAKKSGLVDELKTRDELRNYLVSMTAPDSATDYRQVSFRDYLKTIPLSYEGDGKSPNEVGIIVAEGTILNGDQPTGAVGGDSLARLIRNAQTDDQIKAVVVRINSGGGSVFASEIIRQALLSLKKSGKPYVISMGSVAASGAYWISADADEIWASATTITGSIGIFGAIPTFEDALDNLGVHPDGTGTTSLAAGLDLTRPFSPLLAKTLQISIDRGYRKFLSIVEKGRKLSPSAMDALAEGRVFDGKKAQEIGLVDRIGTMQDAIASAAKKAGLKEYTALFLHKPLSIRSKLLQQFGVKIAAILEPLHVSSGLLSGISKLVDPIDKALKFNDPQGIYAQWTLEYH
jgi:protease IV